MIIYKLAVIIKKSSTSNDFLVIKNTRGPISDVEYEQFIDSELWDLPSIMFKIIDEKKEKLDILISGAVSVSNKIDLSDSGVGLAIDQFSKEVGLDLKSVKDWFVDKIVEEPEFGPLPPIHYIFIAGNFDKEMDDLPEYCKWISKECALSMLREVSKHSDRIGPLAFTGLLHDSSDGKKWKASQNFQYQEYPPGVMIMPMKSRTLGPFDTTNLIIMVPQGDNIKIEKENYIAYGDALLMDPGCCKASHSKLADLVAALPRKLVVFVTHHHRDHTDGLSVVQKCNPEAILLAHENTMNRIDKDTWSLGYTAIAGGEKIRVGGEVLEALFAPGHTDGHLALLHVSTNSLIVGDHCVGVGSAILDVRAGGNVKDYFSTTYKFLELSPHVLIPMHGRINLWPKRMLCGYLKNRKAREMSILKAIESGAQTLFEITAKAYDDVDVKLWLPASSNVRAHVDHLAYQEKLPEEFSMQKFQSSCHLNFICRWGCSYLRRRLSYIELLALLGLGVSGLVLTLYSAQKH